MTSPFRLKLVLFCTIIHNLLTGGGLVHKYKYVGTVKPKFSPKGMVKLQFLQFFTNINPNISIEDAARLGDGLNGI